MLMTAKALLLRDPHPAEEDIRHALAGNLCRCTGYSAIVAAVQAASRAGDEGAAEREAIPKGSRGQAGERGAR
jgi:carbon-monoxide dehydrogenase small subunit